MAEGEGAALGAARGVDAGPQPGGGPTAVSDAEATPIDAERIVAALNCHGVRYVTIGAFAALKQGANVPPTQDIDFTPDAGRPNLERLSAALHDLGAQVRTDAVSGWLPINHDAESLARGGIWSLNCPYGPFGLSFRPSGTDGYVDLIRDARMAKVGQEDLPVASLDDIIRSAEAAGPPKDLTALPVLYEALERQRNLVRPPEPPRFSGPDLGRGR